MNFQIKPSRSVFKFNGEFLLKKHGFPTYAVIIPNLPQNCKQNHLKTFDVRVIKSLKKYILLDASEKSKKVMKEVKYSRDGLNTTQGEPLKNYIKYITDNGGRPMLKTYLDVLVQMLESVVTSRPLPRQL